MKKKWVIPLSCLVLAASLSACNTAPNGMNTQGANNGTRVAQPWNANTYNPAALNRVDRPTAPETANAFQRGMAQRFARVADGVPGVNGATAIVRGRDAVIGINVGQAANNPNRRRYLEQRVHAAVRYIAPSYRIRVTSDPKLVIRIRNMDQTLRMYNYGAPSGPTTVVGGLNNVADDFAALVRDIGRTVVAPFR